MQLRDGVSIDFGGTKISAARVKDGKVVAHIQTATAGDAAIEQQISTMAALVSQLDLAEADLLGVAVTGRVDRNGTWYALNRQTLSQIGQVPLRDLLSTQFGRSVQVLNDATAAAIGEYLNGAGMGVQSLAYITVSTGVGGGFIIDGRPLMSTSGLAGHVGFTTSRLATDHCGSGRLKTVESIAGGKAIARRAAECGHPGHDAKSVFQAHLDDEQWARSIIADSANAVAELCANLKSLLDSDFILLGGSIGLADGYIELVRSDLQSEPHIFRAVLQPAMLGAHAAHIGVLASGIFEG